MSARLRTRAAKRTHTRQLVACAALVPGVDHTHQEEDRPRVAVRHLIEYLPHYRAHLIRFFGIALTVATAALHAWSPALLYVFALLFTFYHIIAQQVGLTGAQLRARGPGFVHDHNRNRGRAKNVLHRAAAALRVPAFVAGPLAAIALACVIERALPRAASLALVYVLSAYHYYLEGVVWRRAPRTASTRPSRSAQRLTSTSNTP